jgi:hypothetical protein
MSFSGITDTTVPWWEKSHPDHASRPTRESFYKIVRDVRQKPYGERIKEVQTYVELSPIVQFEVCVEVLGHDKSSAGKLLRLLKLVKTNKEFDAKVPQKHIGLFSNVQQMLNLSGLDQEVEEIRQALIPRRQRVLTPEETAGYQRLQALEDERKKVLHEYDKKEKDLMSQLRQLRTERDEFGKQISHVVAPWKDLKKARDISLSHSERERLMSLWEGSVDLQERYTPEAYIAAARANKSQLQEKKIYQSFLGIGTEADIRAKVRVAEDQAHQDSVKGEGSDDKGALPSLDAIAPQ